MSDAKGKWSAHGKMDRCYILNAESTGVLANCFRKSIAEHICLCVNSHDDLFSACENVIKGEIDIDSLKRLLAEIKKAGETK